MKLYFRFDRCSEPYRLENFLNCPDLNNSQLHRVSLSPVIQTIIRRTYTTQENLRHLIGFGTALPLDQKYIIAIGVGHAPWQWCGPDSTGLGTNRENPEIKNIFEFLSEEQLAHLRERKAYFLIDQTHEGYHADWLWDWFDNSCRDYSIPPSQIIYLTGDMNTERSYYEWTVLNDKTQEMCVIACPHFEEVIHDVSLGYTEFGLPRPGKIVMRKLPDYDHHLAFKKQDMGAIHPFNILQKRPRGHRLWFFKYLYEADLVTRNIISMNQFGYHQTYMEGKTMDPETCAKVNTVLPLMPLENPEDYTIDNFSSHDGGHYILKISDVTMLKSFLTVVSEASCADIENNCFISEKTFKPIACQHPFIILGSKGVLKNLQDIGYKTFHPYIDESYDSLPTYERMEAIVKELQRLQAFSTAEWLEFYQNVEGILKYNYRHFKNRSKSYVRRIYQRLVDHVGRN